LDQVGVFARTLEDTALIAEAMMVFDAQDPDMRTQMRPALSQVLRTEPPMPPKLAFIRTPVWDQADDDVQGAFEELAEHLGDRVVEVTLPEEFDRVIDIHRTIMESDLALNFDREYQHGKDTLSEVLRQMIERGQKNTAVEYNRALAAVPGLHRKLSHILSEYDAIVTPATTGEAPMGLESTGSPVFCTLWTLCGLPAITVPAMQGSNGMPIGVQMVADRGEDARLLRTAKWFTQTID
jgi:Asp-tRNA(Asn)/Glu-tRNA(Gln) amidotransferase A subunit family amidase